MVYAASPAAAAMLSATVTPDPSASHDGATGQSVDKGVDKGVVTARRGGDGLDGHGHHPRGPLAVDVGREPHHCEQEGEN